MSLPSDDSLESVAKLVGRSGSMRVWWADPDTWRMATMRTTGETDLLHRGDRSLRWVYESKSVTISPDVPVRLPNSSDVLPNLLAQRVLEGARPDEVERLPAERVAGRTAPGSGSPRPTAGEHRPRRRVGRRGDRAAAARRALPQRRRPSALDTRFVDLELGAPDAEG